MNLARQQQSTFKRPPATLRRAERPRVVKQPRRDLVRTWERHRLANRAAMVSLLAAFLTLVGGTSLATALVHSGPRSVLAAAALVALAAAMAAVMRARALHRRLAAADAADTHRPDGHERRIT
jgi:hypothetical protein